LNTKAKERGEIQLSNMSGTEEEQWKRTGIFGQPEIEEDNGRIERIDERKTSGRNGLRLGKRDARTILEQDNLCRGGGGPGPRKSSKKNA